MFLSLDSLASQFPSWSDYNYVIGNPVMFIDPDGRNASPIFDREGEFLGTDDEGIQGAAVVMKRADFEQGMSHDDALSKLADLNSSGAKKKVDGFMITVKYRPDWDGILTLEESEDLYNEGNGQALFVNTSLINIASIQLRLSDFSEANPGAVNFFDFYDNREGTLHRPATDLNVGRVYGKHTLELNKNVNTPINVLPSRENGAIDRYDFSNPAFDLYRSRGRGSAKAYDIFGYGGSTLMR